MWWTRLVEYLLQPLTLSLEVLLVGLLLRRRTPRASVGLLSLGVLILFVSASPATSRLLRAPLEGPYQPATAQGSPKADAIVVLGGALGAALPPRIGPELVDSSDRVLHAARLWKAGRAPWIVASGGLVDWSTASVPEAVEVRRLLVEWGVDPSAVLLETRSRTTRENALETARLARDRGLRRVLLVTSALHMRRASGAFRRAGLEVVPAPTDFSVLEAGRLPGLLPDAGSLEGTTATLHEWIGLGYYAARGWLP